METYKKRRKGKGLGCKKKCGIREGPLSGRCLADRSSDKETIRTSDGGLALNLPMTRTAEDRTSSMMNSLCSWNRSPSILCTSVGESASKGQGVIKLFFIIWSVKEKKKIKEKRTRYEWRVVFVFTFCTIPVLELGCLYAWFQYKFLCARGSEWL